LQSTWKDWETETEAYDNLKLLMQAKPKKVSKEEGS
jgi:hypothetical protein